VREREAVVGMEERRRFFKVVRIDLRRDEFDIMSSFIPLSAKNSTPLIAPG
jgi:hypothetical protein